MFDFLFDGGVWFRILIYIVVLAIVQLIVRDYIGRVVEKAVRSSKYKSKSEERQREQTLTGLFRTALTVAIWIVGVVLILNEFGVNLAAVATGAGLLGIVVGFGAQNTVKDFLSGIFIILENQYRVGDVVTIADRSGLVEQITIRITKLRDLDGSVYYIPNGAVTTVQNMTMEYSGLVIDVHVSYDTDIEKAAKVMNEVGQKMAEDDEWRDRIIEPVSFLRLDSFGDSGVGLKAVGKTSTLEQWAVAGEYRIRLKKAFEKHGIEIPLPQTVIHQAKSPGRK